MQKAVQSHSCAGCAVWWNSFFHPKILLFYYFKFYLFYFIILNFFRDHSGGASKMESRHMLLQVLVPSLRLLVGEL